MTTNNTTPTTTASNAAASAKPKAKKTSKYKAVRATTAKFTSGEKVLVFNLRGLRLSSFVKNGDERAKGKIVEFASVEEAAKGFADVQKKALAAGWDNTKKVTSIDDLISLA